MLDHSRPAGQERIHGVFGVLRPPFSFGSNRNCKKILIKQSQKFVESLAHDVDCLNFGKWQKTRSWSACIAGCELVRLFTYIMLVVYKGTFYLCKCFSCARGYPLPTSETSLRKILDLPLLATENSNSIIETSEPQSSAILFDGPHLILADGTTNC